MRNETTSSPAAVVACGHALPARVRGNDDPIYSHLDYAPNAQGASEPELFVGLRERRYLGEHEQVEELLAVACRSALARAGLEPGQVDRLYGYVSVPPYPTPNPLFALHRQLSLATDAMVVPVNVEFSNFVVGLALAAEAVTSGRSEHALVSCASNWTRHVDYTRGHAFTAGDGAGAAVVSRGSGFAIQDYQMRTFSEQFEAMRMWTRPIPLGGRSALPVDNRGMPLPTYEMDADDGVAVYQSHMRDGLPQLVCELLERNGVTGAETSLITHQGSRQLLDHWADRIGPHEYLETLESFGNMVVATYPVNLSYYYDRITTPYVVIAAVGPGFHLATVLLRWQ